MGRCDGPIVPTPTGCDTVLYTGCVYYDGNQLCVDVSQAAYLNEVLQAMANAACQAPALYESIDYSCLTSLGITTRDEFISSVVQVVCSILGTGVPEGLTSLSDIVTLIQSSTTSINTLDDPTIQACYTSLTGLTSSATLHDLVASLQDTVCLIRAQVDTYADKFVKVNASDTTPGYLSDKLVGGTNISIVPVSGDKLQISATSSVTVNPVAQDTNTVDLNNIDSNTITGNILIDNTIPDNFLVANANGLYVDLNLLYNYIVNNPSVKATFCTYCGTTSSTTTTTTAGPGTTTTTTSTSSTSTTSTTSTTTTVAPDVIRYGIDSVFGSPNIGAAPTMAGNPLFDITVNYGAVAVDSFFWVAYPIASPAKTNYQDVNNIINSGSIGGAFDLFSVYTVTVGPTTYLVMQTAYATNFNGINKTVKYYSV